MRPARGGGGALSAQLASETPAVPAAPGRAAELLIGQTDAQRRAICHGEGPLLVLAAAGSGKTRVITHRLAHAIRTGLCRPAELMAITFTRQAAQEMRTRAEALIGAGALREACIGTFHATSAAFLRRHAAEFGRSSAYAIYDEDDQVQAIRRYLDAEEAALVEPKEVRALISRSKSHGQELEAALGEHPAGEVVLGAARSYEAELERSDAFDFDDLLLRAVELMERSERARLSLAGRFRLVLVDEYQDTNGVQERWLSLLCHDHHNLTVVGDDAQSVYRFRGAEVRNILTFERRWPGAEVVALERNFRSSPQVVEAANRLIAGNSGQRRKLMRSEEAEGPDVQCFGVSSPTEEASRVAGFCRRVIESGTPEREICVLFRSYPGLGAELERGLHAAGLPCRLLSGTGFYRRGEVRTTIAHLRLVEHPHEEAALLRILCSRPQHGGRRGVGERTAERICAYAQGRGLSLDDALRDRALLKGHKGASLRTLGEGIAHLRAEAGQGRSVSALLQGVLELSGGPAEVLRERRDSEALARLQELRTAVRAYERQAEAPSLAEFLERAQLAAEEEADRRSGEGGLITLSTVHGAKGGEWDCVVLSGMEEETFPSARASTEAELEEERRLCYVALTRARRRIVLTHSQWRSGRRRERSRFVVEALGRGPRPAASVLAQAPSDGAYEDDSINRSHRGETR